MNYTVTINGTKVKISNEASFVSRLDERLDTGKVIIPFDTRSSEYGMYDKFNITIDDTVNPVFSLDYRIASDDVSIASKNPLRYRHLLTLIEPTKTLETQVTRELAFTQPVNERIGFKGRIKAGISGFVGKTTDVNYIIGSDPAQPIEIDRFDDNTTIEKSFQNYPRLTSTNINGYTISYAGRLRNQDVDPANVSIRIISRNYDGSNSVILNTFTQSLNPTEDAPFFATINYILPTPNKEIVFEVVPNGITVNIESFDYDVNSEFNEINETTRYTLFDVLDRIRLTTPEEQPIDNDVFNTTRLFSIPSELQTELSQIKSPQLFFDNLTCREAINETLKYVNAIGRIDNDGVLSLDRYNVLVNKFDENEEIIQLNKQQDINDYGTTLLSEVRNQVNESDSDTNIIVPNKNGWILSRTENSAIVTEDLKLILPENIYSPSRLTVKALVNWQLFNEFAQEIDSGDEILEMDLQEYLVEEKVFQSLPVVGFNVDNPSVKNYTGTNYKQNTLYYIYGNNKIENLTDTIDVYGVTTTITNVLDRAVWEEKHISDTDYILASYNVFSSTPEKELLYNFEYIPLFDGKVEIEKTNVSKINKNSVINFNQFNKLISLEKMTNKMYGDIQRYGNEEFQFSKKVSTYNDLYNLGDYTKDGFIITSREIFLYNEFIIGRYECTKDFNRISQFIGVNREYRPFEIPNIGTNYRSTTKYKEFIEVDFGSSGSNTASLTDLGMNTFLSIFEPDPLTYQPAQSCIFIPDDPGNDIVPSDKRILSSLTSDGGTNTMLFTYGFDSPNIAGNQIVEENSKDVLKPKFYTFDDGTLEQYRIQFITELDVDFSGGATILANEIQFAKDLPLIDVSYVNSGNTLLSTQDILIKKDPSEITNGVYQLQTISNNDSIIIGRGLTIYNPLVTQVDNTDATVKFYGYFGKTFGKFDNLKILPNPNSTFEGSDHITINNSTQSITLSNIIDTYDSWAIGDEDGNLYLAVNQLQLDGTKNINYTITFDHINKRSNVDYDWKD